jgi:hypothetical protein
MRLRRGAAQKACGSKMLDVFTGGRSDNAYGCEVQRLGWFAAIGLAGTQRNIRSRLWLVLAIFSASVRIDLRFASLKTNSTVPI